MGYLTAGDALRLIYEYCQKLFRGSVTTLKEVYDDQSLEDEARSVIFRIGCDLPDSVDHLPTGIQKQVYEFFSEAIARFALMPESFELPELVDDHMTDDEKLSRLLCNGISCMERDFRLQTKH